MTNLLPKKNERKLKITLIVIILLLAISYLINSNRNMVVYLSSQRQDVQFELVNLYVDNMLVDSIELDKYYDLNLYSWENEISLGNHTIELRTTDNKTIHNSEFTYFGLKNYIVIGCFDRNNCSFTRLYKEPKLF